MQTRRCTYSTVDGCYAVRPSGCECKTHRHQCERALGEILRSDLKNMQKMVNVAPSDDVVFMKHLHMARREESAELERICSAAILWRRRGACTMFKDLVMALHEGMRIQI